MEFNIASSFSPQMHKELHTLVEIPEDVVRRIVQEKINNMDYNQRQAFIKKDCQVLGLEG